MADIVWCVTADGEKIPLDEHEEEISGEGRYRIKENTTPHPLIEPVAPDFHVQAMVDHREICQKPRPT